MANQKTKEGTRRAKLACARIAKQASRSLREPGNHVVPGIKDAAKKNRRWRDQEFEREEQLEREEQKRESDRQAWNES